MSSANARGGHRVYAVLAIVSGVALLLLTTLVRAPWVRGGESAAVSIQDMAFVPERLVLYEGESVTWVNNDDVVHTVTSVGFGPQPTPTPLPTATPFPTPEPSPEPGALFDFTLAPGESATFSFPSYGRYAYFCRLHPAMTGRIDFVSMARPSDSPAPTPTPASSEAPLPSLLPDASAQPDPRHPNAVLVWLGVALLLAGSFRLWQQRAPGRLR